MIAPGAITVDDGGRVVRIGRARGKIRYQAIVPGLVDAHVHAQLPRLARPVREFVPWIRAVIASRMGDDAVDPRSHAVRRIRASVRRGTTAFGEVDSVGTTPAALRDLAADGIDVAGRCYQELLGFDVAGRRAAQVVDQRTVVATRRAPGGLSPHAPFSVSSALLRAAARRGSPLMVHAAESAEEVEFLRTGRGPFRDLLRDLGRLPRGFRARGETAVEWLARAGALGPRTALIHCQHLEATDLERIRASGASIVVCPGTIRYFRRTPPPLGAWLDAGVRVAIGSDSLASNDGKGDLLGELATARELWPDVAVERLLTCATASAGRAIARPSLGRLRVGGPADMLAVGFRGADTTDRMVTALTSARARVEQVWVRGRPVLTPSA